MIGAVWIDNPDFGYDLENWVAALGMDFSQPLTAAQQQALTLLPVGGDSPIARPVPPSASGTESKQEH